jgi:hypothetical protein
MNAPIPGESLTGAPKNNAWERPPEMSDPEEVIQMHLMRLQDEDRMNAVLDALEFEAVDLYTLVKGLMRSAVANGIHSIDLGLLAAPVVHEYIKQTAEALDIEFDDGINRDKKRQKSNDQRAILKAKKMLKKMDMEPDTPFDRDDIEESSDEYLFEGEAPEEDMGMEEEMMMEEPKKGLMARGQ